MKANLFALLCIALLAVSLPHTFADESVTTDPAVPETTQETPTAPAEAEPLITESSEPVLKTPETADVPVDEQTPAPEPKEQEAPKEETISVVEPKISEPEPQTETDTGVIVTPEETSEQTPVEESEPAPVQEESEPAKTEESEKTPADTAAPADAEEKTEPAPASNENQEPAAPAVSDNQENAAPVEGEAEQKDDEGLFALLGKILIGVLILTCVIFVGCVYNYRYQMRKYKIAPFTPPRFMPECLFPRQTSSSPTSFYTELQVGDYKAAPRYAEV